MSRPEPNFNALYETGNGKQGRGEFAEQLVEKLELAPEPQLDMTPTRISVSLPAHLHTAMKMECVQKRTTIQKLVAELVAERFAA